MSTDIQTKMVAIVGTNGTGKTTFCRNIIESMKVPRKLVLTYHMSDWSQYPINELENTKDFTFKGLQWHVPIDVPKSLDRLKLMYNTLIVFDDARNFFDDRTPPDLHRIYISRRQRANHIIFIAHDLDDIPRKAYAFISEFILFRCSPASPDRLSKLMDRDAFDRAYARVMKKSENDRHYCESVKMI